MDERLLQYLEDHGYTDSWTDNTGAVDGHTIGPERIVNEGVNDSVKYVSFEDSVGTGLVYREKLPAEWGQGPRIETAAPNGVWEITWRLRDSSGRIVKHLTSRVRAVECSGSYEAYCGTIQSYREDESNAGMINAHYDAAFYHPPPLFPY